jgi:protoheme IX farnesyltransferase
LSFVHDPIPLAASGYAEPSRAEVRDFVALLKPRVMSLVVFTALVGIVMAPGTLHPVLAAVSLLCIAVGAGAAGALNMWWDSDIDAVMTRTRGRPVPAGRMEPGEALAFGMVLAGFSVVTLYLVANWQAAALLAFTIFFYVVIYTMWLKRWTVQNIVIGGAAGAFPPIVGWAAMTGTVSVESIVLFLIIFFWTPPHFWALALVKSDDYAKAGVPMLPVVCGESETRKQILIYSLVFVVTAALPFVLGFGGLVYGAASIGMGALFMLLAVRVYRLRTGDDAAKAARDLFGFSVLYLFALFATLLGEAVFLAPGA